MLPADFIFVGVTHQMTSIQSGCPAPPAFKNAARAVYLQPVQRGIPVALAPARSCWEARASADGTYWVFSDHAGNCLSVSREGTAVDTFADDGSGRQRWALEPVPGAASNTYLIRSWGGLNEGAPSLLARMGNLKVGMRRDPGDPRCRWIVLGLQAPAAAPPTLLPPPPQNQNQQLRARDVLLVKRGQPLEVMRESPEFCVWAGAGAGSDAGLMQRLADYLDGVWRLYTVDMKFSVSPEIFERQEWGKFKKAAYLAGTSPPGPCKGVPESGHGYEWQGFSDEGKAFIVTGGFGVEGGCAAHELAHMAQAGTGGFGWGGSCPWAFESCAQYMRWHGCPTEQDGESLKPWLKNHMTDMQKNEGDACYHYGSWLFWLWLDSPEVGGPGTVGRVWTSSRAPEDPLQACSRVTGVPLPDLFARWVAALLSGSKCFNGGPRWDQVNACIGHGKGWNTFDAVSSDPGGSSYAPSPAERSLERNGFHALRLADCGVRGQRRLRLDPVAGAGASADWRMVVAVAGKPPQVLKAGEASFAVPLAKTVLGVSVTGSGALPPNGQSYRVAILD